MRAVLDARAAATLLVAVAAAPRGAGAQTVVLAGVSVLVMTAEDRIDRNRTVVARGDRIVAVGPDGAVPVPAGAVRVDGRALRERLGPGEPAR